MVSLLGQPLKPVPLPDDVRVDFEAKLAAARSDFDLAPEDADAIIWLGRRLAYLGRYQEAIEVYSQGLVLHPMEPRLYRHRGHRYLTTRQLGKAIKDFKTAAGLIEGSEDQIEPDGLPNAQGIPTSTLHSNIWYHLGLAHYLKGDFDEALASYWECLGVTNNPDMLVATSHWLYMTLRRMGLDQEARRVLEPITANLEIIENSEYHQLLLMYRGDLRLEQLMQSSATVGYGIGNWYLYEGNPEKAEEIFAEILAGDQWAAFGYLAAEAEVARSTGANSR